MNNNKQKRKMLLMLLIVPMSLILIIWGVFCEPINALLNIHLNPTTYNAFKYYLIGQGCMNLIALKILLNAVDKKKDINA